MGLVLIGRHHRAQRSACAGARQAVTWLPHARVGLLSTPLQALPMGLNLKPVLLTAHHAPQF